MALFSVGTGRSPRLHEAPAKAPAAPAAKTEKPSGHADQLDTTARPATSPRAPATAAQELPAIGRPRPVTVKGLWDQLTAALAGKPSTLENVIGAAGAAGFELSWAEDGDAKLKKGAFTLKLDDKHIGPHPAVEIQLEGPSGAKKLEGVVLEGTILPRDLFRVMKDEYKQTLEAFEGALDAHGKKPLPTDFESLKAFIESGKSEKDQVREAAQDKEIALALDGITDKLADMAKKGVAPRGVIVYSDGPDGAGKSSTGAIVMGALSKAGYTISATAFKAPTPEEREQHWLQRFKDRGVPKGEMEAIFWDRGPAGDTVYGKKDGAATKKMAAEYNKLEKDLAKQGILLFQLHLHAEPEKQAQTFGKRFARQRAAEMIEGRLAKAGRLTEKAKCSLAEIRGKIDGDDLRALITFDDVQSKFTRFSKQTGAHVIDATKRHGARLEVIDRFEQELEAFGAARKTAQKRVA